MNVPMEHPIVAVALRNNADALQLVRRLATILHTWDDLVDRDNAVDDAAISAAFVQAMFEIPRNPFYRANSEIFDTAFLTLSTNWLIANRIERSENASTDELMVAFIIRSTYIDYVMLAALIIGGQEWAVEHGLGLRLWAHSEGFEKYLENLAAEKAARNPPDPGEPAATS